MSARSDEYSRLRTINRQLKSLENDEAAAYQKHLERFKLKRARLMNDKSELLAAIDGEDEAGPDSE